MEKCPFCGSLPLCHYDGTAWNIGCDSAACLLRPHVSTWEEYRAIASWNQRPREAELERVLRALGDKADGYADDSEDGLRGLRFREIAKEARRALGDKGEQS